MYEDIGEVIALVRSAMFLVLGDEDLAAVATARIINLFLKGGIDVDTYTVDSKLHLHGDGHAVG